MSATRGDAEHIIAAINERLIGAKITGAEFSNSEFDAGEPWYRINLERDGEKFYLEPSIDPEGNAPGFLFMEV